VHINDFQTAANGGLNAYDKLMIFIFIIRIRSYPAEPKSFACCFRLTHQARFRKTDSEDAKNFQAGSRGLLYDLQRFWYVRRKASSTTG
jgi:hypothetical protein